MKTAVSVAVLLTVLSLVGNVGAYTYTYNNGTGYPVRVALQLYDEGEKSGDLPANGSFSISSKALLKSWTADALIEGRWQQILDMTCDLLPGDHVFSIYFDEKKKADGTATRTWNALIK